jgi:soluble lytic murein transglycosylase-like protein
MLALPRRIALLLAAMCACALATPAHAGKQEEENLAAGVRDALHRSVSDAPPAEDSIKNPLERERWFADMSQRLAKRVPDPVTRKELLATVHYEATRAGLDPQMVLGLIQIESRFKKYALSKAGARGYMQVMPFWVTVIGSKEDNLFHLRTNLRYGCTILRHYLDLEKGNLFLALGRYNGSRGKPGYPNSVLRAWQTNWAWQKQNANQLAAATQTGPETEAPPPKPETSAAAPALAPKAHASASIQTANATEPSAPRIAMRTFGGRRDIVIVR